MIGKMTIPAVQRMKGERRKIVGVVLYDCQMAQIADRAGVDIVSAGDSVGVTLWGHASESDVTLDQMVLVCQAVRRGVVRALVSADVPLAALREGPDAAVQAAGRLVREGGADLVKVDAGDSSADAVRAISRSNIPVWAQFGVAADLNAAVASDLSSPAIDRLVREAQQLEEAGASLLDFRYSGPVAGPAVVRAAAIPVIGGLGGGPWLDGRVRSLPAALGYLASAIDDGTERYANVAATALAAIRALCDDVRAARPLRGAAPAPGS
jgi:3-methyl-2-oxobutanoate hydroxymethyltransferase